MTGRVAYYKIVFYSNLASLGASVTIYSETGRMKDEGYMLYCCTSTCVRDRYRGGGHVYRKMTS